MAGRPASIQSRSPLLYWLITFVILWVITLALFVLQLTSNAALLNRAQLAEKKAADFGAPEAYYRDEAAARKTNVAAVMTDDIRKLAARVTGVPTDVRATVEEKVGEKMAVIAADSGGRINPGDDLVSVLSRLNRMFTDARAEAESNARAKRDLEADKRNLTEQLKAAADTFEQQVKELNQRLTTAREEHLAALKQKDDQLAEMEEQIKSLTTQVVSMEREGTTLAREKDIEIGRLSNFVEDLQAQVRDLKPATFNPRAILTKADGRVLRAVPGSDVVYVNLGERDRIRVGMGFEVFSPTNRRSDELRGKASIEVVHVMEETAECRITRRNPADPLIEGDIVVNIAYERDRKPKFVIRGVFDLDYDGVPDATGREQIEAMIRQWGGQVVAELDETVDYVVVGQAPRVPAALGGAASDIVRDQMQARAGQMETFRAEIDQATRMYIPVITQNQFLFLLGYAGGAQAAGR